MRIAILNLLGAALVVAAVTAALRESRSTALARRPVIQNGLAAPPEIAVLEHRSRVKSHLARRVIAERIPLLDAVKLFEEVNGEDGIAAAGCSLPGRSLREKLCHQVILYVSTAENEMESAEHGPTGGPVSAELRAELARRLAAGEFPPDPDVQ